MKAHLAICLTLLPLPAAAQSAFEAMVGTWRGEGSYVEGITEVQLRCRFQIDGDRAAISMASTEPAASPSESRTCPSARCTLREVG